MLEKKKQNECYDDNEGKLHNGIHCMQDLAWSYKFSKGGLLRRCWRKILNEGETFWNVMT